MTSRFEDDRLWDLPRVESHDDGPAPPDELLSAYRAGALPADETTRLEWRLAGSRHGRERLATLAGVHLESHPEHRSRPMKLVAAMLAAAATIGITVLLVVGRGRPPLPDFSVRVEGLASTRGVPGEARAFASERVRVVVEPRGEAAAGLMFGAYRRDDGGLTRLREPDEITIAADRGSASLTAEADHLVGPAEGTRPFFIVVSRRSRLPDRVAAPPETSEFALTEATGGRIYRVSLTITARTENAP
ncbi:MAG TPA: hypothetical protein VFV19_16580 [Candidatus Polarisedimenticolaceae bacterium]|nr:hypothetical protein [Candidatus Polarisedimenticolaceae bacterium]